MPASISIHVHSKIGRDSQELSFFTAEQWTSDSEQELINRIDEVLRLGRLCSRSMEVRIDLQVDDVDEAMFLLKKKAHHQTEINNNYKLSLREIEVLGLIMQGLTNNEIAEKLFICYETVKSHRKNILSKTGAKNTAALVSHYHQTFFEK